MKFFKIWLFTMLIVFAICLAFGGYCYLWYTVPIAAAIIALLVITLILAYWINLN
jgi:hypothetical protein